MDAVLLERSVPKFSWIWEPLGFGIVTRLDVAVGAAPVADVVEAAKPIPAMHSPTPASAHLV
jgi:hypothetical protein